MRRILTFIDGGIDALFAISEGRPANTSERSLSEVRTDAELIAHHRFSGHEQKAQEYLQLLPSFRGHLQGYVRAQTRMGIIGTFVRFRKDLSRTGWWRVDMGTQVEQVRSQI